MLLDLELGLPMSLLVDGTPTEECETPSAVVHPVPPRVDVLSVATIVLKQGDQGCPKPRLAHTTGREALH